MTIATGAKNDQPMSASQDEDAHIPIVSEVTALSRDRSIESSPIHIEDSAVDPPLLPAALDVPATTTATATATMMEAADATASESTLPTSTASSSQEQPPPSRPSPPIPPAMVTVIAPATLSEGYMFAAQVDGQDFDVTVPAGGVLEGRVFQVPYPSTPAITNVHASSVGSVVPSSAAPPHHEVGSSGTNYNNITNTDGGYVTDPRTTISESALPSPDHDWRVKVLSCFDVMKDGLFWQALFLTPILLGQLAQRLGLNACGRPSRQRGNSSSTCQTITVIVVCYYVLCLLAVGGIFVPVAIGYTVMLCHNIRYEYRKRYHIPGSTVEDVCCALWCDCCLAIQMARHTHDSGRYPYQCCTETGLSPEAPPV